MYDKCRGVLAVFYGSSRLTERDDVLELYDKSRCRLCEEVPESSWPVGSEGARCDDTVRSHPLAVISERKYFERFRARC